MLAAAVDMTWDKLSDWTALQPRFLAILTRWCSRHSLQTQPRTYAALVPCWRSCLRVAVSAASSFRTIRGRSW
jgi:hypothetical protein